DFGTSFIPADPMELISTIWVSSEISCTETCNINLLCRTYDYDTLSKRCRLFEGEITTGQVNRSAAIPSTSRVSSIVYTEQLYLAYNQTCDKCQINRYLLCINNICQCTPHTCWNGDRGCCYFYGQISDVTSMSQTINLTAYANDIDNHNVTYNLSVWLGGWAGQNDSAYVSFQFLSSSLSVLGTSKQIGQALDTDRGHTTQLIYRSTPAVTELHFDDYCDHFSRKLLNT
ncbi:unnamed protein product, partial [Didymodactylos carnosus]